MGRYAPLATIVALGILPAHTHFVRDALLRPKVCDLMESGFASGQGTAGFALAL